VTPSCDPYPLAGEKHVLRRAASAAADEEREEEAGSRRP
jgi:hypothetical protein